MSEDKVWGDRVRALRMQRDLTQRELAALIGCAPSSIQNYEAGKKPPRGQIYLLEKALEVDDLAVQFVGKEEVPEALQSFLDSEDGLELPGWLRRDLTRVGFSKKNLSEEDWSEFAALVLEFYRAV